MNGFIVTIIICALMAAVLLFFYASKSKAERKRLKHKIFRRVHKVLCSNYLTRGTTLKITYKLQLLAVYREEEIPELAVRNFGIATGASAAAVAAGVFLSRDLIMQLLCFVFAAVLHGTLTDKMTDGVYLKVLKSAVRALASIEQSYSRTGSIAASLREAKTEALMRRPIDDLCMAITSGDSELATEQFKSATPFRPLQTLAAICHNLNIYGDGTDSYGVSGFTRALTILRGDIDAQIELLTRRKYMFGFMEYLPLLFVLGISPVETLFVSIIPGIAIMYGGVTGYLLRTLTVVVSIGVYIFIGKINSNVAVKADDRGAWTINILRIKAFRLGIASVFIPKKEKHRVKLYTNMRKAVSSQKFIHLYAKKTVFAAVCFSAALFVVFMACALGRDYMRTSTVRLSLSAGAELTERQINVMRVMDGIYEDSAGALTDEQLSMMVRTYLPELSELEIADEIKRIRDKYESWTDMYFRYWFVFIAVGFGILGWFIPNLMLKARAWLIKTEAENDFMELQTLTSILTYTEMDTLSVLGELSRASTVHKELLRQAYHDYPSDPETALENLRRQVGVERFKDYIDQLKMTVSELSLSQAFSNLTAERETQKNLRQMAMLSALESKRFVCSMLFNAAMFMYVLSEFLVPICVLGWSEFSRVMADISNL